MGKYSKRRKNTHGTIAWLNNSRIIIIHRIFTYCYLYLNSDRSKCYYLKTTQAKITQGIILFMRNTFFGDDVKSEKETE